MDRQLDDLIVACGRPAAETPRHSPTTSAPLLTALRRSGTTHVYADTADARELEALVVAPDGVLAEVDGNTANQPLVGKVVDRYVADGELAACARELRAAGRRLERPALVRHLYAILCGRIGNDVIRAVAAGRAWEASLQLHMGLVGDREAAVRTARHLRRMVPTAFVKVPFTPHAPECLLLARDLEREGIPVNLTSTFSARQVVVVALLADVRRTNVFMGRLNQGLEAELLGEHVDLEAQRWLRRLRAEDDVRTRLIVASVREWQTFVRVAGCDVFTAPCDAIRGFLEQTEYRPADVESQLETSYEHRLGVSERILRDVGAERIARLYRVEPELVTFLRELRASRDWRDARDGDAVRRRFEAAGFGDLFHAPTTAEWTALHARKLPDPSSPLTTALALDTLFTLLADADFANHQAEIDAKLSALC
jgi:transaldolase